MPKLWRKGLLVVVLALTVLWTGNGDYRPSALELAVAPYKYSVVNWEVSHFLDKWVRKLGDILPWNSEPGRQERTAQVREFFDLGGEMRSLERRLLFPETSTGGLLSEEEARAIRDEIESIEERRRKIQPRVEETIESEISAVLSQEGFSSRIGVIFPPVDTVFTKSPRVLILSPRDRIQRLKTILLAPGLSDQEREELEDLIFREENLSALVAGTGGVAAYPSVVSDSGGLRHTLETTAHEWLHHWWFFQPLGQHFWDSSQMTTLNETAASLGGQEIGDRAFTAITGERVSREPPPPVSADPGAFDFRAAMHETRLRTDELLAQGRIEEAEVYMEERRQFLADNGHFIRKINQAFFAFHGSYAGSPASGLVSPIDGQLRELRSRSDSLEGFVKTVSTFGSHREFVEYLEGG